MIDYIPENFIDGEMLMKYYTPGMTFWELGQAVCDGFGLPHGREPGMYCLEAKQCPLVCSLEDILPWGLWLRKDEDCRLEKILAGTEGLGMVLP